MKGRLDNGRGSFAQLFWLAALLLCAWIASNATHAATPAQRVFATPDEAAAALVDAVKAHDKNAVVGVLGPGTEQWVWSGDNVADRAAGERFLKAYDQKHGIEMAGQDRATLTIGNDDWPFAFPIVKAEGGWRFATEQGKDEVLARRIGANEIATINVLLAIVDAEHDYASQDHDKDGIREYAAKFASSPGKKDGLYWPTKAGEPESPLGPLVTQAAGEGYKGKGKGGGHVPYHGYYFRILKSQGAHAKGGALDYVVRGHMIGGFAVAAYPASYGNSGVMTFMVNHDGVVYQKDLGPQTPTRAAAIKSFDPGEGWTAVPNP